MCDRRHLCGLRCVDHAWPNLGGGRCYGQPRLTGSQAEALVPRRNGELSPRQP